MAGVNPIKLFQFNQKYCETIGISMCQSNQNFYKLNAKNVLFVICVVQLSIASATFLVFDANSMGEYGITSHILITIVKCMVDYFIALRRLEAIVKFTKNCEAFIEKSEKIESSLW